MMGEKVPLRTTKPHGKGEKLGSGEDKDNH
jgi:hypothetical protein